MSERTSTKITYLTSEQTVDLLAATDTVRNRAIFTVAYWRGLRASEVGLLQMSDWHDTNTRLYVHRVKNSNSGEYLVSPQETAVIRAWIRVRGTDPGPLFPSRTIGRAVGRAQLHLLMRAHCERAGIAAPLNHFHALRHSIAVHLAEAGTDVSLIQDWLGHKSIMNTMVYLKITNKSRDRAAEAMYGNGKPDVDQRVRVGVNWSANKLPAGKPVGKPAGKPRRK